MTEQERQELYDLWFIASGPVLSTETADFWVHRGLTKYVRHDRSGNPLAKHKDWLVFISRLKAGGEFNLVLFDGRQFIDDSPPQVDVMAIKCDYHITQAMYERDEDE